MFNKLKKHGFTLIELMIVVAIIGILAAIAIPNFIRFQAKSKQSEAKTNLKTVYTSQKAYFGEKDNYSTDFTAVGFQPEAGNRYSYGMAACNSAQTYANRTASTGCIGQDQAKFPNTPTGTQAVTAGITTSGTKDFNATAIGNVDNETDADTWAITSNVTGVSLQGTCGNDGITAAVSGSPANAYNDVSCP
ncbi:MAG: prepilin-type N-terminal cleavage/methylation domain-containing protein [Myxococcaceae bacterium]